MEDSFGEISRDPVTGVTKIVSVGAEGAFQLDLNPMPDCECECSGVVTTADGVFYGPVTHATAMGGAMNLPRGVDGIGAYITDLRQQGDFTERRPWSALPQDGPEE